jgi:hypothetical protein
VWGECTRVRLTVPESQQEDSKALRNQFNFSERAAQTQNNPYRDRHTSTEPPPTASFTASCTQWEIYDAYMEDQQRQHLQKEMQRVKGKDKVCAGKGTRWPSASDTGSRTGRSTRRQCVGWIAREQNEQKRMPSAASSFQGNATFPFPGWEDSWPARRELSLPRATVSPPQSSKLRRLISGAR